MLKEHEIEHDTEVEKGMPHIWPLLPIMAMKYSFFK